MRIMIVSLLLISLKVSAASKNDHTFTGTVKRFDEKSVTLEDDGLVYQFDIRRVENKSELSTGKKITISLAMLPSKEK